MNRMFRAGDRLSGFPRSLALLNVGSFESIDSIIRDRMFFDSMTIARKPAPRREPGDAGYFYADKFRGL